MPLCKGKSRACFERNVRTEQRVGERRGMSKRKANKRAVAIALDIQRRASGSKRRRR